MFIAQLLVGPSKQLKQIIQIEHNTVKNPNWQEANQLDIYKRGRGFELGATEKQIQAVVRVGPEPGTAGLRVRHADHSVTLPLIASVIIFSWTVPPQFPEGRLSGRRKTVLLKRQHENFDQGLKPEPVVSVLYQVSTTPPVEFTINLTLAQ